MAVPSRLFVWAAVLCSLGRADEGGPEQTEAGLKPELLEAFGRKHYFQAPPQPKGLVAMLPGCARSVYGYWPFSSDPEFWGFPEDVSHTKQVLKKGYAMLVMTPNDQAHLCWSSKGQDIAEVESIIAQLQKKLHLEHRPLFLMGASSGGSVAFRVASSGKFKVGGFISEVSTHSVEKLGKMLPWLGKTPATSLVFRRSGIWQAMLAAFAHHEHTAEYSTAALTWFEEHASSDFDALAKNLAVTKPAYFSANAVELHV